MGALDHRLGFRSLRIRRAEPEPVLGGAGRAFAAAGVILACPACLLPWVTAERGGGERIAYVFSGVESLWSNGFLLGAVPVLLFGGVLPLALLLLLAVRGGPLSRLGTLLRDWAMPEVQVLAVLVALVKLRGLVSVGVGAGFWCYAAMSLMLILALRCAPASRAAVADGVCPP